MDFSNLPELENAIDGKVVTRFPPECSGYLHLGHVKALLLNYLYAKKYHGKIILRFDDTNPEKEKIEYEEAIKEDIHKLELDCDVNTFTSSYFPQILNYARKLISIGLAYVDSTNSDLVQNLRAEFKPSPCRDQDVETNLELFDKMIRGENQNSCLRAKIDYKSKNGCMRDPVIYRFKAINHPKTGTTYLVYPTYDFACPIVDSLEKVTHAMRSNEYRDRDMQYNWFLDKLELRHGELKLYPLIKEYGKLNFTHTILSKRKLLQLVEADLVTGWDDPRMPTVRGIIRRGMQISPLKSYIESQGFSVNVVNLAWDKLWNLNSVQLDQHSFRIYGLNSDYTEVNLTGEIPESVTIQNHPKDLTKGLRKMYLTSTILIDTADLLDQKNKISISSRITLVGLGNATVNSVEPYILAFDSNDRDYKKTIKVTWLPKSDLNVKVKVRKYGHLLTKPKLEDGDDITKVFNTDSMMEFDWVLENSITQFKMGDIFQVMRKEYCIVDRLDPFELVVVPVK